MSLSARVDEHRGRPVLFINGTPTTETWAYGAPNAVSDFTAAGLRIIQCHVPGTSWWVGPGRYDFSRTEGMVEEFLAAAPDLLIMPRVSFGYEGDAWWSQAHPDDLSVGLDIEGKLVDYLQVRAHPIECWQSAASEAWTRDASAAMADFVRHFEERYAEHILGYQVGGGISCEWFRWWNYIEETYEDYSPAARDGFRKFLHVRYKTDDALRQAWGRQDVSLASAEVPRPARLHAPASGFLRALPDERDVIDWFEAMSEWNAEQLIAVCTAAKRASGGRKLVGAFYGYMWPHWNNQSPARSGHMALRRILACPEIDYISSPYHYDNRNVGGFHNSQTVPEAVERAGKLHLDEVDTVTHIAGLEWLADRREEPARDAEDSCVMLRRDGAAVVGSAGTGWWMDLKHSRWYDDPAIQAAVRDMNALACQSVDWTAESRAEVAFVVDAGSSAYCDTRSWANLYFTSLQRQLLWSDLGFPIDAMLLSEVARVRPYKVYLFLNCWNVDGDTRRAVHSRVRQPGVTSVWFHASGAFGGPEAGPKGISDLVGMGIESSAERVVPEIDIDGDHALVREEGECPRGQTRFGARLTGRWSKRMFSPDKRNWDIPMSPLYAANADASGVLGRYTHDERTGLAVCDRESWRTVYCGAPMLPGWFLRRLAADAGVYRPTPPGCAVHYRGPFMSVYTPAGETVPVQAPPGHTLQVLRPNGADRRWGPDPDYRAADACSVTFEPNDTRVFLIS